MVEQIACYFISIGHLVTEENIKYYNSVKGTKKDKDIKLRKVHDNNDLLHTKVENQMVLSTILCARKRCGYTLNIKPLLIIGKYYLEELNLLHLFLSHGHTFYPLTTYISFMFIYSSVEDINLCKLNKNYKQKIHNYVRKRVG